ncbi:Serine/threonine-protein kinase DCLK3 (CLICK-I and II-related) (CLr) (Doublecortin-like and CAM kinase-like 3) (Doublecortin-like kinase 3), partial [Durusdinium trenchii]
MSESFEARSFVIKSEKVTDGAASKKDLHEPHESRHFTLEERLGSGASSYVYAVCAGGRSWAAKFFRQEQGQTPEALQREAQILADLPRSPYLVDFEGYFSTELETSADLREELKNEKEKHGKEPLEGDVKEEAKEAFYFLLMERCNCSLHSLIENSAFSESEAAFATDAILRGLAHLHSLRVVHRDVKDLNIMVADMGQKVCLGDFDLATKIPVEEELIEWKGGTRGYMAPEVCSQRQGGFKADLFSAGVVLHLLLTRSNPFLPSEGSQGPLDWHIVRLFRSESSCKLMYSLLEEDPKLRPTAEEALDFEWVAGGEA